MGKNVFIYGSCVTRDIFRVANENYDFNFYSRSSLISVMSEPIAIDHDQIKLTSAFQKRTVVEDLSKHFFKQFDSDKPDILLIDLIDERFDVLQLENSFATRSLYFVESSIENLYPFKLVRRFSEETHLLWEKACVAFCEKLIQLMDRERIILHEAYWATEYMDSEGNIKEIQRLEFVKMNNKILKRYYSFIKNALPGIRVIHQKPVASETHIWNLAPFHYTDDYYIDMYNKIIETGLISQ